MPLIKCQKCGQEYDSFYSIHICEKTETEKKEKERQKWETASSLRRIFMYHPQASFLTRVISFLWLLPSIGGLGILIGISLLIKEVILESKSEYLGTYIYIIAVGAGGLLLSYGLSHLKRWSLFLYPTLLIFILMIANVILLGLMGLLGFILVLFDYKRFH